jgi:hypothetical protein
MDTWIDGLMDEWKRFPATQPIYPIIHQSNHPFSGDFPLTSAANVVSTPEPIYRAGDKEPGFGP